MRKPTARLLALALGILGAAVLAEGAARISGNGVLVRPSDLLGFGAGLNSPFTLETPLDKEAPAREAVALAELAGLEEHPWAGVYLTPNRWPERLTLAPAAGFTLYRSSSCWNCAGWRAAGKVVAAEGLAVRLETELGCEQPSAGEHPGSWWCRDEALHFLPWGELLFAVTASRLESFYVDVNDGYTFPIAALRPRAQIEGFDPENPARPAGRPPVLPGYEHLVLDQPVRARLVSLLELRDSDRTPGGLVHHDVLYAIDAGADQGLVSGMRLYVEGDALLGGKRAQLEQVDARSAQVLVRTVADLDDLAQRAVGSAISTLHPKAPSRER